MRVVVTAAIVIALASCVQAEPAQAPTPMGPDPLVVEACEPPGTPITTLATHQDAFGVCSPEVRGAPAWHADHGLAVCVCCGGDLCAYRMLDCELTDAALCEELGGVPRCDACEAAP